LAAIHAIEAGKTKYTDVGGHPPRLKQAIIAKFSARERTDLYAEPGHRRHRRQAGALQTRLMATINPGDEVIIPRRPIG